MTRLLITVTLDDTASRGDELIDELETAAAEHEGITIGTAGGRFICDVIAVTEVPGTLGRPRKEGP